MIEPSDPIQPASRGPGPGAVLDDRYRLVERIAAGGMGTVYRGENIRIRRPVAVKVLHPAFAASAAEVARFHREAQIAVRLSSPHVVEVLDFGRTPGGDLYLVMELLQGESLRDLLAREGRLAPERAARLLRQLLLGLGAAHAAGIVHRDLKPDNLWLVRETDGERLKLLDFGIAKVVDPAPGDARTQVGLVVGTPAFLAPEQAAGGEVDHRADLYCAGILAWLMLTGRHPFAGLDVRALLRAHVFDPVPSPAREVPELMRHPELVRFVARATEKDRAQRAQSAAELLDLLDGREAHPLRSEARPGPKGPVPRAPGRSLRARALALVVGPVAVGTPRALHLALLFAEISGYRDLRARLSPEETARLLTGHDRLVLPAVRAFRGRPVRSRGGELVAAFLSPTDAVLCGMAIQDRLAARAAGRGPAEPLALRLAVHLGESRPVRGDLRGEPLEVAAAAARMAAPGEVWLTRSVYLAMNHGEVPVEEAAPALLGPAPEPVPVYRVARATGPLPFGGSQAARIGPPTGLTRVFEPLADGIASVRDGAAEGRARAFLRVIRALASLLLLGIAAALARALDSALGLAAWTGWRRRLAPRWLEGSRRLLDRMRRAIGARIPLHRAALIRPLT